ncbi:MAG: glycoside hydrolase family 2 TIM barrel-domain containing protein, partial [Bacteroidota bacterium]
LALSAQRTERIYLSGTDKDHTVDWEFTVDGGRRSGEKTTIPVPSHWEQHGFGTYNYGQEDAAKQSRETGKYRYVFAAPVDLRDKHVNLVFDGVMTDATVRLNGRSVGPTHLGAFYRFRYDVSDLLRPGGENVLEVDVAKSSANASVNQAERQADYWIFGGIFRPVWLEVLPEEHLEQVSIDANADGVFRAVVRRNKNESTRRLEVIITNPRYPGSIFLAREFIFPAGQETLEVIDTVLGAQVWSAEFPMLHHLTVRLKEEETVHHELEDKFGFRTVEVRPHDGIYVNGTKIRFKGVNRHCFWPETGRTLSQEVDVNDAILIKSMNMNAVRMSHYPPDPSFLDAADSLGLYIIDELAGWQTPYDDAAGTPLVKEMVERDVNHPSVILWSNGNEGGNNHNLLPLYAKYDPQQRTVIHPWGVINHTDTKHYKPFDCCAGTLFYGNEVFFPTEMQHGMYDGGHGAGLDELWDAMLKDPQSAGGFLWNLSDEGIVRTDRDGFIDTYGNYGADGILGPHREKEGSYYTIREIWSPIHLEQHPLWAGDRGRVRVENRYHRTNLRECTFTRTLVRYPHPTGNQAKTTTPLRLRSPDLEPGLSAYLNLQLPPDWQEYDAVDLVATDPHGKTVMEWTLAIKGAEAVSLPHLTDLPVLGKPIASERRNFLHVTVGEIEVTFTRNDGELFNVKGPNGYFPFTGGPFLDSDTTVALTDLRWEETPAGIRVIPTYSHCLREISWLIRPDGIVQLDYAFVPVELKKYGGRSLDYIGLNFHADTTRLKGVNFLGAGPYRVYKNRMKGPRQGVHYKAHNDAITGLEWDYPEFKGYFRNFHWARFAYADTPFTIYNATDDVFLRLFTPRLPADARPGVRVPYPAGDISFVHAIPPIGTKFKEPRKLGPAGQTNQYAPAPTDNKLFSARLYFQFW